MRDTYRQYWKEGDIDAIVPVPLHTNRFRARGFNQAYLSAKEGLEEGMPLKSRDSQPGFPCILRSLLVREKMPGTQTGSGKAQRMANVRQAYAIAGKSTAAGKRILIVDDVYTTGATADACAGVLMANGAAFVDVLTLARAM